MADVNANIGIHIDSSAALAELKALQRQLATFHASIAKNSAASSAAQKGLQQNLLNAINATGQFHAQMGLVRTSTESFTHALENNKLSMREYFRYAGASTKSFGKLFKEEFNTIGKVAEERVKKMQTQYIKMGRDASGAMKAMSVTPSTLNMNDYGNKTAIAAQKQALFNQLVKQGSTSLLNFGKNTQWAGRQLMVGFSVPLMYIGSIASKTFMEMEEQAIRFRRVYGDIFTSAGETEKAVKNVEDLAKSFTKYGVAFTETMKMAADAAAMGKTGADLTAQISEATRLSVLGGVEQQQALETTISLTNAFGIAADQLAGKINFLNAVENQTVVSIEDLTIAIPKAGPVVQQLGGDVEDLAFFLTAMKEGGINASEGANALKSGLAALINPTKKASEMLLGLGVNINGIVEGNAGDLKGTVVGFAKALDTLDPLNRARAIEQLFGKFQFARLSTLFKNITTDGTQASKVLKLTEASVEELAILSERELKKVEDAVGVNFKESIEDLKVSIMPIGKAFLEALTPIVKFAAEILKKFDGLGDGTKKFIVVATTLVGILGPTLLMTFGLVANGAANIVKLFLALRTGFLKLGGNTTVLSQQTSYLNAEQLEAATVAASLNQAHTRLTQSFNLEATAVHALRNAYVQATTAALTFARANPGMMMPGFKGSAPKKFAQGATYVPGTGNKDTVPSMLTPGEAIIPADVAQNPAYQPIIDAMVNGNLQGFNKGTTRVSAFGNEYNAKTAKGAKGVRELLDKFVATDIDDTYVFRDPKTGINTFLTTRQIKNALNKRSGPGQDFTSSSIQKALNIGTGRRGSGISSSKSGPLKDLVKKAGYPNKVGEQTAIEESLNKLGINPTQKERNNLFGVQASHIVEELDSKGNKVFKAANLVADPGWANNYLNTVKGNLGQAMLAMTDDQLKTRGTDRASIQSLVDGRHPDTAKMARAMQAAALYDIEKNPTKPKIYQAHAVAAGMKYRFEKGFYPNSGSRPTIAQLFPDDAAVKADADPIFTATDKDVKKSKFKNEPVTKYGQKISGTSGWSFKEANHLGGLYQDSSGNRVFVKPMMTEAIALAEMRGTEIARRVHGLETPEQTLRVIEDPATGKKLFALESPYNEKFDPATISKTFTKDSYIKQLVASMVRGDTDLKKGNLGGDVLTDVGRAGVLDKASGMRKLTTDIPSMKEIAEINLGGVPGKAAGNSPRWFGNATADIAKGMTSDEYSRAMMEEIQRVEVELEKVLKTMPLTAKEKPFYEAMLHRVRVGKLNNWKSLHQKHTSIVIKPDELIEDVKTGKLEKPKTKSKPSDIKSSSKSPKDTKTTTAPGKGKRVVQGLKGPKMKVVRPGFADAPISQVAASGLNQFGMQPIDPVEFKRQSDALNKNIDAIDDNTVQTKASSIKTKDLAHKSNIAAGAVAGLTMMAAFSGGKLGEMATQIMPFVFGLQGIVALLPLLANPWVAAVAAIAALGVSLIMMNKQVEDARKEGIGLANAMSMTSKKLTALSVITGTVSASEEASKRRENIASGTTEGQRQVGQNILESDFGKNLLGDIDILAKSGLTSDAIAKNVSTGLSQAVLQGVITTEQARSIASALGEKLGSYEIPAKISGDLVRLLGPDGSNLYENPLEVALKIKSDTYTDVENAFEQALAGANVAAVSKSVSGWKKALEFIPKIMPAGLLQPKRDGVNAAAAFTGTEIKARNAKLDAAAVQLGAEAISQNQKLLDGVKKEYDIKIKNAKTEKEITDLQAEKKAKVDDLNIANAETLKQVQQLGSGLSSDEFTKAIGASIDALYKDSSDAVKTFANQAKDNLSELSDTPFKKTIQLGFASGDLSAPTVLKILEYAAQNKNLEGVLDFTINKQGFADTALMVDLLTKTGTDAKTVEVLFNYINNNKEDFDTDIAAAEALANMAGNYGITLNLKANGVAQIVNTTRALTAIKDLPEKLDFTLVQKLAGENPLVFQGIKDNWATLSQGKDLINKNLVVNAAIGSIDPNLKAAADAAGLSVFEFIAKGSVAPTPTKIKKTPDDTKTPKPRDTTLDELMKKLKFVRDASINAEGNIKNLMNLVSGKGITKFAGVSQQLMAGPKGGSNREFISMLESMDNKTRAIYMTEKKGVVTLTDKGKALKEAYNEKVIGEYQNTQVQTIQDTIAQQAAFVKLKAAGVDTATALDLTADASLAVAINSGSIDAKKMQELAKQTKAAKNETLGLARAFEEVFTASRKDLKKATDDLRVLRGAKETLGYSTEDIKIIAEDPALLGMVKRILDGDGTGQDIKNFQGRVSEALSNIKAKVKVEADKAQVQLTAKEIAQQLTDELQKSADSLQSIFDHIADNIRRAIESITRGISKVWDSYIATAQSAIDKTQSEIDDTYTVDPNTGIATKTKSGLQTKSDEANAKVEEAQRAADAQEKIYTDTIKKIEDSYFKESLDKNGNIIKSGFIADAQSRIDAASQAVKDLQNKGDIDALSLTQFGAAAAGDFKGNNLTLAEAEKAIEDVEAFIEKTYSRPIEMLQQAIAGQQKTLEISYTREIEKIQKKIEDIQTKIAKEFEKPLSKIQEESTKLSEDLAVMDNAADAINKKYEVQENALTKIAEINQDIVEQQKQQLGLADALSKGDISAAAAAVQDMRATQAAKSLGAQQGTLGKAKEAELAAIKSPSGLTRDQIAERQYALERASYQIQQLQKVEQEKILALQEQIYAKENDPARLKILKDIQDSEDEIYRLDTLRLQAVNAVYAVQDQIKTRNTEIATQQAALAKAEKDLQDVQDKREKELKAAELKHSKEMEDFKTKIAEAEKAAKEAADELAAANKKLAEEVAALEAVEKAKAKAIADATAKAAGDLKTLEDQIADAGTAVADLTKNLGLAEAAAKLLAGALAKVQKEKDDQNEKDLKAITDKAAAEKKAAEEKAAAEKKIFDDKIAAAKAKITAAEDKVAAAQKSYDALGAVDGDDDIREWKKAEEALRKAKAELEEARKAYAFSPEGMQEFRNNFVADSPPPPPPPPTPGPTGPNGTYAQGLALNPQFKAMDPATAAAILKSMGYYRNGGLIPQMFAAGGFSKGTDTIPAMLTPGEFIIKKSAVDSYGVNNLSKINNGMSPDSSVYNYSLSVNVSGNNLNADDIASTVMQKIKYIDGQRVRGQR